MSIWRASWLIIRGFRHTSSLINLSSLQILRTHLLLDLTTRCEWKWLARVKHARPRTSMRLSLRLIIKYAVCCCTLNWSRPLYTPHWTSLSFWINHIKFSLRRKSLTLVLLLQTFIRTLLRTVLSHSCTLINCKTLALTENSSAACCSRSLM